MWCLSCHTSNAIFPLFSMFRNLRFNKIYVCLNCVLWEVHLPIVSTHTATLSLTSVPFHVLNFLFSKSVPYSFINLQIFKVVFLFFFECYGIVRGAICFLSYVIY